MSPAATDTPTGEARERPAEPLPEFRRRLVVGVDDSPAGLAAARWAGEEAHALDVPLLVIGVYSHGPFDPWRPRREAAAVDSARQDCELVVGRAVAVVREEHPQLVVTGEVVEGSAHDVLEARGRDSSMVVVGTRHRHPLGKGLLGSVSGSVAATAPCPVVVALEPGERTTEPAAVVVGLTGEPGSESVLAFAFAQARLLGLPVKAVLCWRPPPVAEFYREGEPPPSEQAQRRLAGALAGWRDRFPDIEVRSAVMRDHAVAGLVAGSRGQPLLVVGRHGHRPRFGAALGSISQGVLHHAACPVAVVPLTWVPGS